MFALTNKTRRGKKENEKKGKTKKELKEMYEQLKSDLNHTINFGIKNWKNQMIITNHTADLTDDEYELILKKLKKDGY